MKPMTHLRGIATGIAAMAIATGCGTAAVDKAGGPTQPPAPIRLSAANVFGLGSVQNFVQEVDAASKGTIEIDATSSVGAHTPDSEATAIDQVRSGKADIGMVGSRAWPSSGVTSYDALHAPFLIDSYALEQQVLESPLVADMETGLEPLGLVGIGVLPGDLRVVLSRTRAFERPADFVGASVAISRSVVGEMTYRALGATSTPIALGDPIDRFDAVEVPVTAISGNGYDSIDKIVAANVRMWPRPIVIFMSTVSFERLSPDQQSMLRDASLAAIPKTLADLTGGETEFAATSCRRGVQFVAASGQDLAALRAAVQPVYDQLDTDPLTRRLIAAITGLKASVTHPNPAIACGSDSSPTSAPSGAPSSSSAGQVSPIEGSWEACPTAAEIVAAGGEPAEAQANAGCVTLTFNGGTVSEVGASASTNTPGTYVVDGNRVTIYRSNAEVFHYEWNVFQDTLTFKKSENPGELSPAPWLARSFRRIGG